MTKSLTSSRDPWILRAETVSVLSDTPWIWILHDFSADFVELFVVVEVVEFDDRVIKLLSNLGLTRGIGGLLIGILEVEAVGERGSSEEAEGVNSVFSGESESVGH